MYYSWAKSIVPGEDELPTSHLSVSLLQIDWPAPQDKKRECVAKGKNNQVMWILADVVVGGSVPCSRASWQKF